MDARKKIETDGYIVLPNMLTEKECDQYRALLDKSYDIYAPKYASNSTITGHGLDDNNQLNSGVLVSIK